MRKEHKGCKLPQLLVAWLIPLDWGDTDETEIDEVSFGVMFMIRIKFSQLECLRKLQALGLRSVLYESLIFWWVWFPQIITTKPCTSAVDLSQFKILEIQLQGYQIFVNSMSSISARILSF